MNRAVTSQEKILKISKKMLLEKGIPSFSMRIVAAQCGIAVGSIYNYFPSKADLLSATIASIWKEIFKPFNDISEFDSFIDCVSCMFETIKNGDQKYSGFFTVHSLNFASEEKDKGKEVMHNFFHTLERKLIYALEHDKNIRKGVFQNGLSMEIFANYIFTLLMSILLKRQENCQSLLEMIKNCIY